MAQLSRQAQEARINLKKVQILSGLVLLCRKLSQHYTELIWLYPASCSLVCVDLIKLFSEMSSWSYAANVCLPSLLTQIYDSCNSGKWLNQMVKLCPCCSSLFTFISRVALRNNQVPASLQSNFHTGLVLGQSLCSQTFFAPAATRHQRNASGLFPPLKWKFSGAVAAKVCKLSVHDPDCCNKTGCCGREYKWVLFC